MKMNVAPWPMQPNQLILFIDHIFNFKYNAWIHAIKEFFMTKIIINVSNNIRPVAARGQMGCIHFNFKHYPALFFNADRILR